MRRNSLKAAALLVLLLALGIGVTRLLQWRYSRGDVYPPYSTLRSDPLGARLLMDGLEPIESLRVRRNTGRLERLWDEPRTTIFLLGVGPDLLSMEATADDLELLALVRHGARAVIAARPEAWTLPEDEDEVKATGRPHDRRVERPDGGEDKEGTGKNSRRRRSRVRSRLP